MNTKPHRPPAKMSRAFAVLVLISTMPFLSACAKAKPLTLSFEGEADMNGGFSCLVCVYQLRKETSFTSVPSDSFWSGAAAPFQADLVEPRTEVILEPGEKTKNVRLKLSKETRFIGAAADFRRPDRDAWRKVVPVSAKKGLLPSPLRKSRKITIVVSAGGIEVRS